MPDDKLKISTVANRKALRLAGSLPSPPRKPKVGKTLQRIIGRPSITLSKSHPNYKKHREEKLRYEKLRKRLDLKMKKQKKKKKK